MLARKRPGEKRAQRTSQRPNAFEFEQMDEFAQRALVSPGRINLVEAVQSRPAESAQARFVKRALVEERSSARATEIFGLKRRRLPQAGATNWNSGKLPKRTLANAALIGKNEIEKAAGHLPPGAAGRLEAASETRWQTTREDSPPRKF